ncbi:MAG: YfdQ family protein [Pseudomonas sagittaria]|nr:YfdQ family protein [Pseudomonas sagittaria]
MNEALVTSSTGVAEAIAFGSTLADPKHAEIGPEGQMPYAVIPEGFRVEDLEDTLANPTRKRAKVTLAQTKGFIDYFKKHQVGHGVSTIYGTTEPPRFVAVFNDHGTTAAGWRDHVAYYNCPLAVEWETWTKANKRPMAQTDFAQFIEDNLPDIVDPTAAEMLEISRTLEAKKKVNFASGLRLSNGEVQFTYEESVEGTAAKGQLRVPEVFAIGIPAFHGGPKYRIEARLRYRIADGGVLSMWFDLVRPHKVLEDAALEVWEEIEAETSETIFQGNPGL